jgi:hypothetical protein
MPPDNRSLSDRPKRTPLELMADASLVTPREGDVWNLIGQTFTLSDPPHSNTPPCDCRRCRDA